MVRIFLNVVLILVSFIACYLEDFYLYFLPPQKGTVVPFTIRLRHPFHFDQEKALGLKRVNALSKYVPLYTYVPTRGEEASAEFHNLLEKVAPLNLQKTDGPRQLMVYIQSAYGLEAPEEAVRKLLRYRDLRNFVNGVLTLVESVLQGRIVEDPQPIAQKKTYEVLYPKPSGIVAFPATDMVTLDAARLNLQQKIEQLFWQTDKSVRDVISSVAMAVLKPNLIYDRRENNKRIEEIMSRYPSTVISFKPGHILLPFRHKLTENDLPLVTSYREEVGKDLSSKAPWVFIAILLSVIFYTLVLEKIIKDEWRKDPPFHLFISLLCIAVLLLKACLLITPVPVVALPFGVLPLVLVLLQSDRISATWTSLTAGLLVSLFSGYALNVLLFFSFAGMAAVIIALKIRRRMHILFVSFAVAGVNAVLCFSFWLDWSALFSPPPGLWTAGFAAALDTRFVGTLSWAFLGGLASGPLALLLLPLLEMSWHTASTFRLSRYADLQHPLLKELLTKTPATYQHTMSVAYLSQSVGEAIGANTLLLRLGAYYHDIGKVANPRFFAENQSGKNPHDDLDPQESARIIIDHVLNGEKIGRGMKLPQVILDFIIQHHGTQTVEFFYNKAAKNKLGGKVQKKDFQYPGPKPQSVEAAIVMICDAVEAASRSLEAPTRETIENMVRLLLIKRLAEGQFDECHLSTAYLSQILRTLVSSLEASFHSRVVYPWQERQKEKIEGIAKAASS